jgi:uncharacterized protein involved in outer membrane biogenesis
MLLIGGATILVVLAVATLGLYWFFSGDGMRRALEAQAASWLGRPVRIGAARAQIFPRPGIGLRAIEVGEPVQLTLSRVDLSTDLGALLRRRIEQASVVVSDSQVQMPLPFAIPGAGGEPSPGAGAVHVVSIRDIALRDVRLVSRGREVRVSADAALDGSHLALSRFTAESGSTSLEVEGAVDLEPSVNAKLRATATRVDLDELLALAHAFSTGSNPGVGTGGGSSPSSMRIAAQITADSATAAGVQISRLQADMIVEGDRVALSPLTFGLFSGSYEGSLTARIGESLTATLQSRLQRLDVAQLAAFGGTPDTITGTLNGAGTFSARGADLAAVLASASGKGSVSILDGTIRQLNLVRTVVLFFGRPAENTPASTDKFDRMDTSFSLSNQVVTADSFSLHSRDADVTGTGTLSLASEALDGTANLVLSEELSAQAGTDLARFTREGNRVVLPARIGGTLSAPSLSINTSEALNRGLRNEVQRRLKDLFDQLKGQGEQQK